MARRAKFRAHRKQHQDECDNAESGAHRAKSIPTLEQLVRVVSLAFRVEVQQAFVGREDDEERERHDREQEKSADEVPEAAQESPRQRTRDAADHSQRRLHDGGAPIARRPR